MEPNLKSNVLKKTQIFFYDFVLLFVGLESIVLMLLLALGKFSVNNALLLGAILLVASAIITKAKIVFKDNRISLFILLLLLVGIFFRIDNFTNYIGGYDTGLYVDMSETFIRDGSLNFFDHFRASLSGEMLNSYDELPLIGVSVVDSAKSLETIEYYPLHPAWMALFKGIFGLGHHTYSLLFFSILSMLGIYLLTLELTNNDKLASCVSLIIFIINPALVFFSKLPVTEIVAIALSVNGFYLLLKGLHSENKTQKRFLLFTSLLLFNAFLYTRMSFYIFMPLFLIIFLVSYFPELNEDTSNSIRKYCLILPVLFISNLLYYYFFQKYFFSAMYGSATFKNLFFVKNIYIGIFLLIILLLLLTVVLINSKRIKTYISKNKTLTKISTKLFLLMPILFIFVLLLSAFTIIPIYATGEIHSAFKKIPYDIFNFKYSSIYRYLQLISPFGFLLLFTVPFFRIKLSKMTTLLLFFLITAWAFVLYVFPVLPYLYFYSRYLTSEMVTYSIIFISIILSILFRKKGFAKVFAYFIFGGLVTYSLFFSVVQVGKVESEKPEFFYQLNNVIKNEDVVVLSAKEFDNRIPAALRLYFDKQVFFIRPDYDMKKITSIIRELYRESGSKYGNIYYLTSSSKGNISLNANIDLVGKYIYKEGMFSNSEHPRAGGVYPSSELKYRLESLLLPIKHIEYVQPLYLYKIVSEPQEGYPIIQIDNPIKFSKGGNSNIFAGEGWGDQEDAFRWTISNKTNLKFKIDKRTNQTKNLICKLKCYAYADKGKSQKLLVNVNGKKVGNFNVSSDINDLDIKIPSNLIKPDNEVKIQLNLPNAHSPMSAGQSKDNRNLGIAVMEIVFLEQ